MVDLRSQYLDIKTEVDSAIGNIINSTSFIKGPAVSQFESNLEEYLNVNHVIGCGNGTDALQIALMALDLQSGDEVIVPSFTYAATAEIIALLGLTPVMVDVSMDTFEILQENLEELVTEKTKAIIPVHLFGQTAQMTTLLELAKKHKLYVVEDAAQSIGSVYKSDQSDQYSGTIGHIGTTSFFPSKNLGCYGDGGAIFTNDSDLAKKIRMIGCHGESIKYHHDIVGCNSRLDSIQAAVLDVKLKHLDWYNAQRYKAARYYTQALSHLDDLITPIEAAYSSHIYHQYTLRVTNGKRNELSEYLKKNKIPFGIYYPIPLYKQKAYSKYFPENFSLANTEILCDQVISLPIHSHITTEIQDYIIDHLITFFKS